MKKITEIVVLSGKGGTGKTTLTACLADIMGSKVLADCDVDAANMHILLKPAQSESHVFNGMPIAYVNPEKCSHCGTCQSLCRFDALVSQRGHMRVDPLSCEGCGLCKVACLKGAVEMKEREVGQWFLSQSQCGDFVHARLTPGSENSGKLVTMVKEQARLVAKEKGIGTILVDGPPGIGCPVMAAVSGASQVVIVTEPTQSGYSDLERIVKLTDHFGIPSALVINRFDINLEKTMEIESFAREKEIPLWAKIPHSTCLLSEISRAEIPSRQCIEIAEAVNEIYVHLKKNLDNTKKINQERRLFQ